MRRAGNLALALLLVSGISGEALRGRVGSPRATRITRPLVDRAATPAIGRCTSDGACTVTDEAGRTRRASRLALSR